MAKNKKDEVIHISKDEILEGKGMATLSYVFALIPYLSEKDNQFVKFHAKEGMNLFTIACIYFIIESYLKSIIKVKTCTEICYYYTPWAFDFITGILKLVIIVFCGIGIFNVLTGKIKKLPIIGRLNLFK